MDKFHATDTEVSDSEESSTSEVSFNEVFGKFKI